MLTPRNHQRFKSPRIPPQLDEGHRRYAAILRVVQL
jgi:hypothetical protein